ncbi:MAG: hypothetical protein K9J16_17705 [Melioribacteraceae bacterium]|nr:hypothetical protein [Melioribacteraceae bacterium]MCF8353568.1 hypothetical protein [Melioribacteraceae bacterium]MCF8393491.1 hypothetical protein [Melioribacteraceae bacterium]MCF8419301.1 hypothetical protein [Melioribacteraceae bacterium]
MNIIRSAIVLLILITLSLSAQSKYLSHNDQYSTIKGLVNDHSSISRIIEIGKTTSDKELYVVEIAKGDVQNKPGFLVIAGVEPDDLAGTAAAQDFIEMILNNAEVDSIKSLIENYSLYVLPRLSPDALDGYFENVKSEYLGNHQSYDLDRDGFNDEDGFNDLNNDNLISMMRIEDPEGEWIEEIIN